MVDIHNLTDRAQRFVVGVTVKRAFEKKEETGTRTPLLFLVLDELNKYAPREGTSPIKEILLDVAERGRSLGMILVGAQQTASEVERRVIANSSLRVAGRLDPAEAMRPEYGFLLDGRIASGRGSRSRARCSCPSRSSRAARGRVPVPGVGDPARGAGRRCRRRRPLRGPALVVRILHTSDWHVGKTIRGESRLEEHVAVLAEIAEIAAAEAVDLILVAGDLYESAAPSAEAETVVTQALLALRGVAPLVVIAGNHDNAARFEAIRPLAAAAGIEVRGRVARPDAGGVVTIDLASGRAGARRAAAVLLAAVLGACGRAHGARRRRGGRRVRRPARGHRRRALRRSGSGRGEPARRALHGAGRCDRWGRAGRADRVRALLVVGRRVPAVARVRRARAPAPRPAGAGRARRSGTRARRCRSTSARPVPGKHVLVVDVTADDAGAGAEVPLAAGTSSCAP